MDDIELFKKIDLALRSEPKDGSLIASVPFSVTEINRLKEILRDGAKYHAYGNSPTDLSDKAMKAFIILAVNKLRDDDKDWKGQGRLFWPRVCELLFDDDKEFAKYLKEHIFSKSQTNDQIDEILKKAGRIVFRAPGGSRAFAQTLLFQAMAPRDSMKAFVQLAWSVYLGPFLEGGYEEDMRLCEYIVRKLHSKVAKSLDSQQDIQFGGAVYALRQGIKYGLAQNQEKSAHLLNKIFQYIQRVDLQNEDISSDRLGTLVTEVVTKAKETALKGLVRGGARAERKNAVYDIEKYRPSFYLDLSKKDEPKVILAFPRLIIIDSNEMYGAATPTLYKVNENGNKVGELPISFPKKLFKITETCQILPSFTIDVTDVLKKNKNDFYYQLFIDFDNGDLVDTRIALHDYLLFKGSIEIRGQCPVGDYYLVVPSEFNPAECIDIADSETLTLVRQGIYFFCAAEGDSISYGRTYSSFGAPAKNASFFFEDKSLLPSPNMVVVKEDAQYRVYNSFSDIVIKPDQEILSSPHLFRVHVKNEYVTGKNGDDDEEPGVTIQTEDRELLYSDLFIDGNKAILDCETSTRLRRGLHRISIKKLGANQAKELFALDCVIDRKASLNIPDIAYSAGDYKGVASILLQQQEVFIHPGEREIVVPFEGFDLIINPPYFEWFFQSSPEKKHIRQSESDKPLFYDCYTEQGVLHTEVLCIDTSLEVLGVYAQDGYGRVENVRRIEEKGNRFAIGQFAAGKKGLGVVTVFANVRFGKKERALRILSLTNSPYLNPNAELRDHIFLREDGLHFDFRGLFFHGNKKYAMRVNLTSALFEKDFNVPDFSPDEEYVYNEDDIGDDLYQIDIRYSEIDELGALFGAEKPKQFIKLQLEEEELPVGNLDRIEFIGVNSLELGKCSTVDCNPKLKGVSISMIQFDGYDDENYPTFRGKLRLPDRPKSVDIIFSLKNDKAIRSVKIVVHTSGGDILKETYVDINGNALTDRAPVPGKIIEYKSIYFKRQ